MNWDLKKFYDLEKEIHALRLARYSRCLGWHQESESGRKFVFKRGHAGTQRTLHAWVRHRTYSKLVCTYSNSVIYRRLYTNARVESNTSNCDPDRQGVSRPMLRLNPPPIYTNRSFSYTSHIPFCNLHIRVSWLYCASKHRLTSDGATVAVKAVYGSTIFRERSNSSRIFSYLFRGISL